MFLADLLCRDPPLFDILNIILLNSSESLDLSVATDVKPMMRVSLHRSLIVLFGLNGRLYFDIKSQKKGSTTRKNLTWSCLASDMAEKYSKQGRRFSSY